MTFGLLSDTAMSSRRPPMLAGPIDRNRKLLRRGSFDWLISGPVGVCCPPRPCAAGRSASALTPKAVSATARMPPLTCLVLMLTGLHTPDPGSLRQPAIYSADEIVLRRAACGARADAGGGPAAARAGDGRPDKNPVRVLHAAQRPDDDSVGR